MKRTFRNIVGEVESVVIIACHDWKRSECPSHIGKVE